MIKLCTSLKKGYNPRRKWIIEKRSNNEAQDFLNSWWVRVEIHALGKKMPQEMLSWHPNSFVYYVHKSPLKTWHLRQVGFKKSCLNDAYQVKMWPINWARCQRLYSIHSLTIESFMLTLSESHGHTDSKSIWRENLSNSVRIKRVIDYKVITVQQDNK